MFDAWRYAQRTTGLSARPHSTANGAARSFVAALRRLGWRSPAYDALLTREGHLLKVGDVDVVTIMRYAEDDLMVRMGIESAVGRDINDPLGERGHYRALPGAVAGAVNVGDEEVKAHIAGSTEEEERLARIWRGPRYQHEDGKVVPWLLPATMLLRRRLRNAGVRTAADASVAALVEGGWWTPARRAAAGLGSSICASCGRAVGTLWHRLGDCSTTKQEREGAGGCPGWLLKKARASVWDPLFARGVPALPNVPPPPPAKAIRTRVDGEEGDEEVATGDVYTDGAVRGRWRRIMRAGWGVVVLKEGECRVAWKIHGSCPEVYPSVFRAELTAVLNVLRVALPPLRVHVDNSEVVKGFGMGREWCLEPGRDGGELWKEVWARMEDLEGEVEVVKVKAHTTEEDVDEGVVTERDRYGNMHADAEAKRGARLAESLSPVGSARTELLKALRWLGWARRFAAIWRPDVEEGGEEVGEELNRGGGGGPRQGAGLRHLVWQKGAAWKCRRCGRLADTEQKRRDMRSSRCLGSAVGRLLSRTCDDPGAVERACVERREDLSRRGWRAWEGGGDDVGDQWRGAREFEEEHDVQSGSEAEEERQEGEGAERLPEDEGLNDQGGGAAADSAAAAASGSASASAVLLPCGGLAAGFGEQEGPLGESDDGPPRRQGDEDPLPFGDIPEFHEQEIRAALAERAAARAGLGPRGAVQEGRSEPRESEAPTCDPGESELPEDVAQDERQSLAEAVLGRSRGGGTMQRRGKRAGTSPHSAAVPAAKRRRTEAGPKPPCPPTYGIGSSSVPLGGAQEVDQQGNPEGWHLDDEHFDEDPFGHVADALAAQPRHAGPWRGQAAASGEVSSAEEVDRRKPRPAPRPPLAEGDGRPASEEGRITEQHRRRREEQPEAGPQALAKRARLAPEQGVGDRDGEARAEGDGRAGGGQPARVHGRRYTGIVADPVDAARSGGHQLKITGPIIYCGRCGRYASRRIGKALKAQCIGLASGAYSTRLERLNAGRHPITGIDLV